MTMKDKSAGSDSFDWEKTTFHGARREQLRRWAELPLENIISAIEEMEEVSRELGTAAYPQAKGQVSTAKEPTADYSEQTPRQDP